MNDYDKQIKDIYEYLDMLNIKYVYEENDGVRTFFVFEELTPEQCNHIHQFNVVNDINIVYEYNYDETKFTDRVNHIEIYLRDYDSISSLKEELEDEKEELGFLMKEDTSNMNEQELKIHNSCVEKCEKTIAEIEAELESASEVLDDNLKLF